MAVMGLRQRAREELPGVEGCLGGEGLCQQRCSTLEWINRLRYSFGPGLATQTKMRCGPCPGGLHSLMGRQHGRHSSV